MSVDAEEADGRQVWHHQRRFPTMSNGGRTGNRRLRLRGERELRGQTKHTDERRH